MVRMSTHTHRSTHAHKGKTEKKGGGSVLSKYRPQQQHSLKYFIASSPEMKREEKGKIEKESERERDEQVEGGPKGFRRD